MAREDVTYVRAFCDFCGEKVSDKHFYLLNDLEDICVECAKGKLISGHLQGKIEVLYIKDL